MRKKWWLIPVAIIAVFIILNPSMNQFKEFAGKEDKTQFRRTSNYLILSIYEYNDELYTKKYLGVLSNFYILNPNVNSYIPAVVDSPVVVEKQMADSSFK